MAGLSAISDAVRGAESAPGFEEAQEKDFRPELIGWPLDAPVTPLGVSGLKIFVLDALKQLISIDTRLAKGDLALMYGGVTWLTETYPQYGKGEGQKPKIVGFDQKLAAEALILACHRRGIFSPVGRLFGRGAHSAYLPENDDNRMVLHMGRRVLIAAADKGQPVVTDYPVGEIDGSFFPAFGSLPAPASEASEDKEALALLAEFEKWYWVEAKAAPLLLLGMVAQMHICGALAWRSHVWLAAPTASGKSSLLKLIQAIHGNWCLYVEDASEAAIRQILDNDTLPVIIDEAERDDNPDRQRAIMNLAKKASSGAKIIRGGADHKGQEFVAQSSFLFASVLHSLSKGEERNRMAILEMRQVPEKAAYDPPDLAQWRGVGRKFHRRMIEQWSRFHRTLTDYRREIASHGFEGRWQDTFGTLLACADCLLYHRAPSQESELNDGYDRVKPLVASILPMMVRGKSEARSDVERCIAWLMASQLPSVHGKAAETVGQIIVRGMQAAKDMDGRDAGPDEPARARLKSYGLRLVNLRELGGNRLGVNGDPLPADEAWETGYLAVSYGTSRALAGLFVGTEWADGGWIQSLAKVDGAQSRLKVRFAGPNSDNAIAVPLKALRDA